MGSFQYGDAGDNTARCFNDVAYPGIAIAGGNGFVAAPVRNVATSAGGGSVSDGINVEFGNQDRGNICRLLSQSSNKIIQPFMGEQAFFTNVTTSEGDNNLGATLQPINNGGANYVEAHHDRLKVASELLDFDAHVNGSRASMI